MNIIFVLSRAPNSERKISITYTYLCKFHIPRYLPNYHQVQLKVVLKPVTPLHMIGVKPYLSYEKIKNSFLEMSWVPRWVGT